MWWFRWYAALLQDWAISISKGLILEKWYVGSGSNTDAFQCRFLLSSSHQESEVWKCTQTMSVIKLWWTWKSCASFFLFLSPRVRRSKPESFLVVMLVMHTLKLNWKALFAVSRISNLLVKFESFLVRWSIPFHYSVLWHISFCESRFVAKNRQIHVLKYRFLLWSRVLILSWRMLAHWWTYLVWSEWQTSVLRKPILSFSDLMLTQISDIVGSMMVLPNRQVFPMVAGLKVAQMRCPNPQVRSDVRS